jgi:thymidylate synthase
MYFRVINGKLDLVMKQDKADVVIGVPSNMIQYAAFLIALAHVTGFQAGTFHHFISDAHIYIDKEAEGVTTQIEAANIILSRTPRRFPKLELTSDAPDDIFAFRTEHFVLSEYDPHPAIKNIGTAI